MLTVTHVIQDVDLQISECKRLQQEEPVAVCVVSSSLERHACFRCLTEGSEGTAPD